MAGRALSFSSAVASPRVLYAPQAPSITQDPPAPRPPTASFWKTLADWVARPAVAWAVKEAAEWFWETISRRRRPLEA
jgi:hypothetical protein